MNLIKSAQIIKVRGRGFWTADARSPVTVSDPEKLETILGFPVRRRGSLLVPVGYIEQALKRVARDKARELERLLSGSRLLWKEAWENIVVNEGLDHLLDVTLSAATPDTSWFLGLTDGTPTVAAGDTLVTHAGWVEQTGYDEVNRVAFVEAGVSGQSISNTASPAVFTINATLTIGGAFLAGVNTGTAGILYAAGAFTAGDKILNDNDTLSVTSTFTMAAA